MSARGVAGLLVAGAVLGAGLVALASPAVRAGLAGTLSGLGRFSPEDPPDPSLPGVSVRTLRPTDWTDVVTVWGRLRAPREATLRFRAGGTLRRRPVEVGTRIGAGDEVAALDDAVASAAVREAEALLEKSRADLRRAEELARQSHATESEHEARAAEVAVRVAALARARDLLAAHVLRAPFAGTVTATPAEPGEEVSPGMPVVVLAETDPLILDAPVAPHRVPGLAEGSPSRVSVDGRPGAPLPGELTRIPPSPDPATRLFRLEISVPNHDGALRPGLVAHAEVQTTVHRGVLVLPRSAIEEGPGEAVTVRVVEGGIARSIVVGDPLRRGEVVLVRSPALEGRDLVVRGPRPLPDGTRVRPVPEAAPPGEPVKAAAGR